MKPELNLVEETDPDIRLDDIVPQSELSIQSQRLIDYASRKHSRTSKNYTKENIAEQFESVFRIIGGVPRLALWADANPASFYTMYSKLLPTAAKVTAELNLKGDPAVESLTIDQLKALAYSHLKRLAEAEAQEKVLEHEPTSNP